MNTPHDPYENLTFVDALIQQNPDWEPEEVVLVIGDGIAVFDEEFPYDERVYFHFDNAEQYETAKTTLLEDVGFVVLRELEEEEGEE